MSSERDTIPAPPINPATGDMVTYEQLADRFDGIDQLVGDMKRAMLDGFFNMTLRLNEDARDRKELLEEVLGLARDNRKRIEALEAWRTEHEENCERKSSPNGRH